MAKAVHNLPFAFRPPRVLRRLMKKAWWRYPDAGKTVFLTFDDGPIPVVTPWVCQVLAEYDAKATFFCVGENVVRNPTEFRQLLAAGHAIGNHTMQHLDAWRNKPDTYLSNVKQAAEVLHVPGHTIPSRPLFRPPYGHLTLQLYRQLSKEYQLVMWDLLTWDFDPDLPPSKCLKMARKYIRPGAIVVFHDSLKAFSCLKQTLPPFLTYLKEQGYRFGVLC